MQVALQNQGYPVTLTVTIAANDCRAFQRLPSLALLGLLLTRP
jgi:hypothetical protein